MMTATTAHGARPGQIMLILVIAIVKLLRSSNSTSNSKCKPIVLVRAIATSSNTTSNRERPQRMSPDLARVVQAILRWVKLC